MRRQKQRYFRMDDQGEPDWNQPIGKQSKKQPIEAFPVETANRRAAGQDSGTDSERCIGASTSRSNPKKGFYFFLCVR